MGPIQSKSSLIKSIWLFTSILFLSSHEALARMESPLWVGAEAKTWAGAAMSTSSGSTALFYNPANIITNQADLFQYDLTILSLKYSYEYPDLEPVEISKGTLIPYFGLSKQMHPDTFFAFTFLPYPGSAEATEIKNLPTRETGDTPIIVNVEQKGPKLAWRGALGVSTRINESNWLGFSILFSRDGVDREVTDVDLGLELQTEVRTNDLLEGMIGYTLFANEKKTRISFRMIPFGKETKKIKKETLSAFGTDNENRTISEKRPLHLGAAAQQTMGMISVIFELNYTAWENVKKFGHAEYDYFNTISYAAGLDFLLETNSKLNFAAAYYPTHLGDGIIAERSYDDVEIIGIKTGDLDGFNRLALSCGYRTDYHLYSLDFYISYQNGSREVFEDSREYGQHELSILMLGAGGHWKL